MTGWQPIETAPKDGTQIYIVAPGWEQAPLAKWECLEGGDEKGDGWVFGWALENDDLSQYGDGWLAYEDDEWPTHWMPLSPETAT